MLPYTPCLNNVNKSLKTIDKKVVFTYNSKLGRVLTNNKPPKPAEKEAGVYRINCTSCEKCYIGETGRNLPTRIKEHKRDVRTNKIASGLAVHSNTVFHNFDFNSAELIFKSNNLEKRHVIESALININKDKCVNLNKGHTPLNDFLSDTIHKFILKHNS